MWYKHPPFYHILLQVLSSAVAKSFFPKRRLSSVVELKRKRERESGVIVVFRAYLNTTEVASDVRAACSTVIIKTANNSITRASRLEKVGLRKLT